MIRKIEELPFYAQAFIKDITMVQQQSENTAEGYCADLRIFFKYLKEKYNITEVDLKCLKNLTFLDLNEYLSYMTEQGKSKRTKNRALATFKRFFQYLKDAKLISENITENIKATKLKGKDSTLDYLKMDETQEIFDMLEAEKKEDISKSKYYNLIRNECIIQVFLDCCLRRSELTNLKIAEINMEEKYIDIFGKGEKERIIYFNRDTWKELNKWFKIRKADNEKNDYVFTTSVGKSISDKGIAKIINEIGNRTNIDLHPHKLRHTGLTIKHKSGVDIRTLQMIAGHSSITTTQIYTHVDEEQLKQAAKATPSFRKRKRV